MDYLLAFPEPEGYGIYERIGTAFVGVTSSQGADEILGDSVAASVVPETFVLVNKTGFLYLVTVASWQEWDSRRQTGNEVRRPLVGRSVRYLDGHWFTPGDNFGTVILGDNRSAIAIYRRLGMAEQLHTLD